jgi:hypothetical protein
VDVSDVEHRHGSESLEPVGARRKHDGHAIPPALAGSRVLHGKAAITHERFDPRPLATGRDPRSQVSPGLDRRGSITPRLREHAAPAQHPPAAALSIDGALVFNGAEAFMELREHLGRGSEFGRNRQRHLERVGPGPIGPEEVQRSRGAIVGQFRSFDAVNKDTVITEGERVVTVIPGRLR